MSARILWAVVGGFLSGVFLASTLAVGYTFALFCTLLGAITMLFGFVDRDKTRPLIIIAIVCIALGGGIARMHAATRVGDAALSARTGDKVTLEGVVVAEPDARERNVRLTVAADTLIYQSATTSVDARVLVVTQTRSGADYGDYVRVSGELGLPEAFATDGGRHFDYPKYLAKDGILYMLSFAQVERLPAQAGAGENRGNPIKAAALAVKRAFLTGLGRAIPEPEAGLAGGITVGDKRSIGEELSSDFQRASLIHMVVLSGYNITIVINAIIFVIGKLGAAAQFSAAGVVVVFFALISGGAATAVRAGSMALIAIFARVTHRTTLAERILGVVCALMVLWNPWTLVYDPSFQLSALATLGLVLFTPIFAARMPRVPAAWGMREILASTLATQLTVLPLLLYQSGSLSLVALPANLLALVSVPYAMAASFVAALAGLVLGPIAPIVGAPAYALLWYEITVAQLFSSLPFAAVSIPAFSAWWVVLAYAIIFGWYRYYSKTAELRGSAVR
jgi:competence protein ComEC